ncbi:response regulator transcription factor [Pedobacter sp. KBS0701]|uniref:LytR/AlgR family response regulator transcription factor n=1 Tax=Pedobacter sp. KBS0701 TaxID=2578106 RepID=UPI00110D92AE|nr:LytTR family DNA-binding domain-containing protein [Pedobacter sp. KBS0701]QDW25504.1 response regulator transcription factor [Pedobacter sp. KBS0701]
MKTYNCIIIDDEEYAIKWLSEYVKSLPYLRLIHSFQNPVTALTFLSGEEYVDLIILDIKMPLISGIDLSQKIRCKTKKLVFSTAHRDFAYDAFEVQADGYLLKPYSLSKFASTIGALFPKELAKQPKAPGDDFFFAKNKNDELRQVKIFIKDIIAVESKQNYVMIYTTFNQVLTHLTLSQMSSILKNYEGFAQFQRSFIISKYYIESIHGNTLKMTGGKLEITVGDYYKKDFAAFLSDKVLKCRT